MKTNKKFEDLEVWNLSRKLNIALFETLTNVDYHENGFLKNHVLKTAGSIMDNIAEGYEREGNKEFIQFLFIAKGSAGELRSQLQRLYDFKVLSESERNHFFEITISVSTQLSMFIKYLRRSNITGNKYK